MTVGEKIECIENVGTTSYNNEGHCEKISFSKGEKYYIFAVTPQSVAVSLTDPTKQPHILPRYTWFSLKGYNSFYRHFEDINALRKRKLKKLAQK